MPLDGRQWINGYSRRDGTSVRGHWRSRPGGGRIAPSNIAPSNSDAPSYNNGIADFALDACKFLISNIRDNPGAWSSMLSQLLSPPQPQTPAPVAVAPGAAPALGAGEVDGLSNTFRGLSTREQRPAGVDSGVLSEDLLQRLRDSGPVIKFADISYNRENDLIGEGSFGAVFKAEWQTAVVALKRLHFQSITRNHMQDFTNEIRVLASARHPHVVQFLGTCVERPNLAVVTEFLGGGSLWDALHVFDGSTGWSREKRLHLLRQACSGLLYLHHLGVSHRDVKSANLLLSADVTTCKVADFGLSRVRNGSVMTSTGRGPRLIGTLLWAAPEILEGGAVNRDGYEKADVYSFAVVCSEVLAGVPPYGQPEWSEQQLRQRVCVQGERPSLPADLAADVRAAIERAWDKNPSRRPTMGQLYCALNGEPIPEASAAASGAPRGTSRGAPATSGDPPGTQRQRRCIICLERAPTAMLQPCRHAVMCKEWVLEMMERAGDADAKCPVCRTAITEHVIGNYNESLVL